jgi:hypothetical protein
MKRHKAIIIKVTVIVTIVVFAVIYYSKGFCQLHHGPLVPDKVKVVYGLVLFQQDYNDSCITYFPNAKTEVFGGCVSMPKSKKTEIVFFCPKCRKAKRNWQEQHNVIK